MAPKRNAMLFVTCLMLTTGAFADESVIDKTEAAVKHGAHWTATKVEHGAKAAAHGVKIGVDAAGHGLHRAADATARTFHKVAGKVGSSSSG